MKSMSQLNLRNEDVIIEDSMKFLDQQISASSHSHLLDSNFQAQQFLKNLKEGNIHKFKENYFLSENENWGKRVLEMEFSRVFLHLNRKSNPFSAPILF